MYLTPLLPFNDDGLNEEFKTVYSPYGLDLEGGYEMANL